MRRKKTGIMEIKNTQPQTDEKTIIKQQYVLFFVALISFIPLILLSKSIFHTMKYGLLVPIAEIGYIGVSSIKYRVSIIRSKGSMKLSRERQAVMFGVIILVGAIADIIFILTPFSDILFSF
jgi:hypothetical protein